MGPEDDRFDRRGLRVAALTPIEWLLLRESGGARAGTDWRRQDAAGEVPLIRVTTVGGKNRRFRVLRLRRC